MHAGPQVGRCECHALASTMLSQKSCLTYAARGPHANPAAAGALQAMTFVSLNAAVVAERRSRTAGLLALLPLQLAAAASVAAWQGSEAEGRGDLRPYLLMQGLAGEQVVLLSAAS